MKIGIDGNMWYCSNGLGLPDAHAQFTFERTLRQARDEYRKQFNCNDDVPKELYQYLDSTPEQYKSR